MRQNKKLYIILVAVCVVVLVGLIVLAVSLDASRRGSGNHSTEGQTQSTGDTVDTTGDTKADETTEGTDSTDGTTDSTTNNTTDSTTDSTTGSTVESTVDGQEQTKPSVSTEPGGTTGNDQPQGGTQPSQPDESQGSDAPKDKWSVTYEEYNAMSGAEQEAFYYSFDSADDYFKWYKAAKQAYEDSKNDIVIGGDGSIDLGEILNGKN